MRTVGQILKDARLEKLYTLEDVEKNTKIRKELLQALEADDYDKLPPATFIQGFIKNYGKFLNLEIEKLLAVFRRDFEAKKHPPVVLESFKNPIGAASLRITPAKILAVTVTIIILGFFAYLWFEYRQFAGAPALELTSPSNPQTVEVPTVVVEGTTDPDAKVTINNQEIGLDNKGHFKEEIKLASSVNKVVVTSTSKFGQSTKQERTVFVKK